MAEPGPLETHLRAHRAAGRKALIPYLTGGLGGDWAEVVRACAAAGADAIEIGIPFSDPVMDGPTIQEASERALAAGATPQDIVAAMGDLDTGGVPLVVMTYYNVVYRNGHERFASSLAKAGVGGAIVPDLPYEEVGPWAEAADAAGVETVLLAALTGVISLVGVLFAGPLTSVLAPGFAGDKHELTVTLTRIMFPGIGFLVLSAWCLGVLNSHRRFFLSYVAPVLWNAAMITMNSPTKPEVPGRPELAMANRT